MRRQIAVSTSEDLRHWSPIRAIIYPQDDDQPDFDNLTAMAYGNDFVGFLHTFDNDAHTWQAMRSHLAFSRDGLHWSCHRRRPFLEPGFSGLGFDEHQVILSGTYVPAGDDRILLYMHGLGGCDASDPLAWGQSRLAILTLRRDGFVGCRPGRRSEFKRQPGQELVPGRGFLLTREFIAPGATLTINCNAAGGSVRVEVLQGPAGEVCAGYGRDECVPVQADSVRAPVRWREHEHLASFIGQPIRLRFILDNAVLYSMQFS